MYVAGGMLWDLEGVMGHLLCYVHCTGCGMFPYWTQTQLAAQLAAQLGIGFVWLP
jgi:hypothetical protein